MALSMLVDRAELNDHGVILEYQLGKHQPPARRRRPQFIPTMVEPLSGS